MPVQFICSQCSQLLSVGSRKIGTQVTCPRCRRSVVVPTPEAAALGVAMRQSSRAQATEEPLAEFIVYDDIPAALEAGPPIQSADPVEQPPSVGRVKPARRSRRAWLAALLPAYPEDASLLLVSRRVLYLQAALFAIVAVTAFVAGLWIGRGVAPQHALVEAAQAGEAVVVQGKLEYTDASGKVQGDAGAVVLAVPEGKLPSAKLDVAGLRPADAQPAPGSPVLLAIEALGGAYQRVEADGSFSLAVPEPGQYFVCFISRQSQRPAGVAPDEFQLALMKRYFDSPEELVGQQKFLWKIENLQGLVQRSHKF